MKTVFAAHLIPGSPAKILSDHEAAWLNDDAGDNQSCAPQNVPFIYVKGANASVSKSPDGRFTTAICGQYSIPDGRPSLAEWIMHAFPEKSVDCFRDINGSWRLMVIDHDRETALAAVDRMGSTRICFAEGEDGSVAIGHSNVAVAKIRNSSMTVNPNSILKYFYFHCIPSPDTFFKEIQCLMASDVLLWDNQGCRRRPYWKPAFAATIAKSDPVNPADLLATLDSSVQSACPADRTATFLSGGLDSSTVLGLACKHLPGSVTPYTIGFDEPDYDETSYARIAAEHFGVAINRFEVTPDDVVEAISTVAAVYDEPFGNSSAVPTYFCALAAAAGGENLILAGDGGDELFAGNVRYRTQQIFSYYHALPEKLREALLEPVFLSLLSSSQFYPIRKIRRYIEQARLPMPDRLQTYNLLNVHGIDRIFTARFLDAVDADSPLQHMRTVYTKSDTDCLIDKMLYLDWQLTLGDNDLRKVTTMCEHANISVRYPMLDNRLIDLSCKLPGSVKMRRGKLRDFFKKSVRPLLPEAIINKPKHGFGLPFGPWFAKSDLLRNHVQELLDSLADRDIVSHEYLRRVRKATLSEHAGYHGEMIWLMCVLEAWFSGRPDWKNYKL